MSSQRSRRRERTGVRIIAGKWRSRRLEVAPGTSVRPTPDRVRETLFNWIGPRVEGARCLDLFAGSGVLGLEALSRGASSVDFVERDRELATAIAAKLELLGADSLVHCLSAESFVRDCVGPAFDIVFVDPPYESPLEPILEALGRLLHAGSIVYAERPKAVELAPVSWGRWDKVARAGGVGFGLAIANGRSP